MRQVNFNIKFSQLLHPLHRFYSIIIYLRLINNVITCLSDGNYWYIIKHLSYFGHKNTEQHSLHNVHFLLDNLPTVSRFFPHSLAFPDILWLPNSSGQRNTAVILDLINPPSANLERTFHLQHIGDNVEIITLQTQQSHNSTRLNCCSMSSTAGNLGNCCICSEYRSVTEYIDIKQCTKNMKK